MVRSNAADSTSYRDNSFVDMDSKRVDVVVRYLKDKGIAENRIIKKPSGIDMENPEIIATDDEDMKMAKSRRIAYKVVQ